jgi:BirA family biotin operon repressor/biotin-[acetyl-CoA-carboxylase] ligase
VHIAEGQSAGRGRLGRRWASARGEGLYLSVVLLPESAPRPAALTMGAGLAVCEAVQALGAHAARLKWPNDVLVAGAKLAGILVEARGLDPRRPHAVVGVGLNVRQREFPAELEGERAVTSLARLGLAVTLDDAAAILLTRLAPRLEAACLRPAEIARDYAAALGLVGRAVHLRHGRGEARGRLEALALDGLTLASAAGERRRFLLEHVQALEAAES